MAEKCHPRIKDFEILGRIGGGAYGEVFLAKTVTGQFRAIKVVRRGDFDRERTFSREFEGIERYVTVAKNHPGLVDVYHVGRNDDEGFYYYAMELADDAGDDAGLEVRVDSYVPKTLAHELKLLQQRSINECVEIGLSLVDALGYLHEKGLTHRDVKPSNIIFIEGKACLADVGLVARTGQRTFVGTEGYVPPEGPGTGSADLYAVAMILYEMVTGKDRMDFPELPTNMDLPRTMNRDEWRALNSVICRAAAPDPKKRYESASTFSNALRQVEVVGPHEKEPFPWKAIGTGAIAVFLLLAGIFGYFQLEKRSEQPVADMTYDSLEESGAGSDPGVSGEVQIENTEDEITVIDPFAFSIASTIDPVESLSEPDEAVVFSDPIIELPPPATLPERPVKAPKEPAARLKISSSPAGAKILFGDKEIGETPSGFLKFDAGKVELTLRKPGYIDHRISKKISGRDSDFYFLKKDNRPVVGEPWQNSLGISFKFDETAGTFYSEKEIGREPFSRFKEETGRPMAVAVPVGTPGTVGKNEDEIWAFCEWMTTLDRSKGFLGNDQYYAPQLSTTKGKEGLFFCRIDNRFGAALITSEPSGVEIFKNNRPIGRTPLTLNNQRVGPLYLTLKHPGYENFAIKSYVAPSKLVNISSEMKRNGSVVFGKPWTNSLGMKFVPVEKWMASIYETRVSDYAAFLENHYEEVRKPNPGFHQDKDHPVAGITIDEARAFCAWLTKKERAEGLIKSNQFYRLPLDTEWSVMAGINWERGNSPSDRDSGVENHFPWGSQWPPPDGAGNFADAAYAEGSRSKVRSIPDYIDGYPFTSPVGEFEPNQLGIFDLGGNVWEWVEEPYKEGRSSLSVVRGGNWAASDRALLLTSVRNAVSQYLREGGYGFRCVLVENE